MKRLVAKADSVRFVTFTIPRDEAGLGERIDKLLKSFSSLRRRDFWKQRVKGGLFVVETTRGRKGEHWHVHLHVLVEGDYMAQAALKAEWSSVIGETAVVDIRAVHGRDKAVNYICKYVSKGSSVTEWDAETICEFAEGVHRRRLVGTFGKWHSVDVNEDKDDAEPEQMPRHGTTWGKLKEAMDSGTLPRRETVEVLWSLGYLWRLLLAGELNEDPECGDVPHVLQYDSLIGTMLDIEGVAERDQGAIRPMNVAPSDPDALLWSSTGYL